jgi:hypothetical protein
LKSQRGPESSACRGRAGAPGILDRNHNHAVEGLKVHIHADEPAPWAENETEIRPAIRQLRAESWKALERSECPLDTLVCVAGQSERSDESVEVFLRRAGYLDPRHESELFQADGIAGKRLLLAQLHSLPGAWDRIQDFTDALRVRVRVVKRGRKQRPGQGALLDMSALGQSCKLGGALGIQSDVEPGAGSLHDRRLHDSCGIVQVAA